MERALAIEAAKVLDAAEVVAYYDHNQAYSVEENTRRHLALARAQTSYNRLSLAYFLGVRQTSVHARLKRRAKLRKAEAQRAIV
jgi:hypothetical protein